MKFVKISSIYKGFINSLYSSNPDFSKLSSQDQQNKIYEQHFGSADYYAKNLIALGVDAHEIIWNADHVQTAWANENGFKNLSLTDIVTEQLKQIKPDIIWFHDSANFNGTYAREIKKLIPSVKVAFGNCCFPLSQSAIEKYLGYDFVIACSEQFVDQFKKLNLKTYIVRHAFEATIVPEIAHTSSAIDYDLLFIGSVIAGKGFHGQRKELLEAIVKHKNIHTVIRTNAIENNSMDIFMQQGAYYVTKLLKTLGQNKIIDKYSFLKKSDHLEEAPSKFSFSKAFKKTIKPPVYGLDMYRELQRSKMVLNTHIDIAGDYAANMRLFEATGVGACLVTDYKKNINDLFEEDKEIVTFKNKTELIEKLTWLMDHPQKAREIAKAGQQRTLKDHTFANRTKELHNIFNEWI